MAGILRRLFGNGNDGEAAPALPVLSIETRTSSAEETRAVQRALVADGIDIDVDGDFGPQTQAALRAFQQRHGLPVTGTTDEGTWGAITATAAATGGRTPAPVAGFIQQTFGVDTPAAVDDHVAAAQTAILAGTPPAEAFAPAAQTRGAGDTYTVRSGDNLTAIARRLGTTVEDLARINNIPNVDVIRPGQILQTTPPPAAAAVPVPRPNPDRITAPASPPVPTAFPQGMAAPTTPVEAGPLALLPVASSPMQPAGAIPQAEPIAPPMAAPVPTAMASPIAPPAAAAIAPGMQAGAPPPPVAMPQLAPLRSPLEPGSAPEEQPQFAPAALPPPQGGSGAGSGFDPSAAPPPLMAMPPGLAAPVTPVERGALPAAAAGAPDYRAMTYDQLMEIYNSPEIVTMHRDNRPQWQEFMAALIAAPQPPIPPIQPRTPPAAAPGADGMTAAQRQEDDRLRAAAAPRTVNVAAPPRISNADAPPFPQPTSFLRPGQTAPPAPPRAISLEELRRSLATAPTPPISQPYYPFLNR